MKVNVRNVEDILSSYLSISSWKDARDILLSERAAVLQPEGLRLAAKIVADLLAISLSHSLEAQLTLRIQLLDKAYTDGIEDAYAYYFPQIIHLLFGELLELRSPIEMRPIILAHPEILEDESLSLIDAFIAQIRDKNEENIVHLLEAIGELLHGCREQGVDATIEAYRQIYLNEITNRMLRTDSLAEFKQLVQEHPAILGEEVRQALDTMMNRARANGQGDLLMFLRARAQVLSFYRNSGVQISESENNSEIDSTSRARLAPPAMTFRVFISSTFSDFQLERDALHSRTFPRLQKLCQQHNCDFQPIDLRWGINELMSVDQQTMQVCLEEITRCKETTKRPNFMALIGDRSGWHPLPTTIPIEEYTSLDRLCAPEESALLQRCYLCDSNAIPPVYCLSPRRDRYNDPLIWMNEVERPLRTLFKKIAKQAISNKAALLKYSASATEQEVYLGTMQPEDEKASFFFFFRNISDIPRDLSGSKYADLILDDEGAYQFDEDARAQLTDLKTALSIHYPDVIHSYEAHWSENAITTNHIDQLCEDVYQRLSQAILEEIAERQQYSPLENELLFHEAFARDRASYFIGRKDILDTLQRRLQTYGEPPIVISGVAGSGKSSLLAYLVQSLKQTTMFDLLAFRFIGATAASTDSISLLGGLCEQIAHHFGNTSYQAPNNYQKLCRDFKNLLQLASAARPLCIVIDELDQLRGVVRSLEWVPQTLPPYTHILISTRSGTCLDMLKQLLSPIAFHILSELSPDEGEQLLTTWLTATGRTLTNEQRTAVLQQFEHCRLPLYLKLVFEEARLWRSYTPLSQLGNDIPSVIVNLIARLSREVEQGNLLVHRCLVWLRAARNGLSDNEILDLLSRDQTFVLSLSHEVHYSLPMGTSPGELRIPTIIWSRLYFGLKPYLLHRQADGTELIAFFHRQFEEVIDRDLLPGEEKQNAHRQLADYFAHQPAFFTDGASRLPNLRQAAELLFQQIGAQVWDDIQQTLSTLLYWETRAEAGQIYEFSAELEALSKQFPSQHKWYPLLSLLGEALRTEIAFIARHPPLLFQSLWNRCWWYDCPSYDRYYLTERPPTQLQTDGRLSALLLTWRTAKEQDDSNFQWMRALRPPRYPLGSAQYGVLRGHLSIITCVTYSSSGRLLASAGNDYSVRVWDRDSGAELNQYRHFLDTHPVCVAFSPDEHSLVAGAQDGTIVLWDRHDPIQRTWMIGHQKEVRSIAFSPDGRFIASGGEEGLLKVWDAQSGECIFTLNGHQGIICTVAFTPDSTRVATIAGDRTVRIWHIQEKRELFCLYTQAEKVTEGGWRGNCLAISPRGDLVAAARDNSIILWNLLDGQEVRRIEGQGDIISMSFSRDGVLLVTGVWETERIRVWNVQTGQQVNAFVGHEHLVRSVAFSPVENMVASAGEDKMIILWNIDVDGHIIRARGHSSRVTSIVFHPTRDLLASASWDSTVRLWNTLTGEEHACLREHKGRVASVRIAPNGKLVASSGEDDSTIRLWDIDTGREVAALSLPNPYAMAVAFSYDSQQIVSGDGKGTLYVWHAEESTPSFWGKLSSGEKLSPQTSWRLRTTWQGCHEREICAVAFSPDGSLIASASWDSTVRLWNAKTGENLGIYTELEHIYSDNMIFSDDGRFVIIVGGAGDRTVHFWDIASKTCTRVINGVIDIVALAKQATPYPLQAMGRFLDLETAVMQSTSDQPLAWIPELPRSIAIHPHRAILATREEDYLAIYKLEKADRRGVE